MKKVLVVGLIGLALFGLSGCAQKVEVEKEEVVIPSKCDMGKATSKIAKCGN
ncbi:MAG: hypothetical protein QM493_11035 [Sulfurovum sp.]